MTFTFCKLTDINIFTNKVLLISTVTRPEIRRHWFEIGTFIDDGIFGLAGVPLCPGHRGAVSPLQRCALWVRCVQAYPDFWISRIRHIANREIWNKIFFSISGILLCKVFKLEFHFINLKSIHNNRKVSLQWLVKKFNRGPMVQRGLIREEAPEREF